MSEDSKIAKANSFEDFALFDPLTNSEISRTIDEKKNEQHLEKSDDDFLEILVKKEEKEELLKNTKKNFVQYSNSISSLPLKELSIDTDLNSGKQKTNLSKMPLLFSKNNSLEFSITLLTDDVDHSKPPRSTSFNVARNDEVKAGFRSYHKGRFSITLSTSVSEHSDDSFKSSNLEEKENRADNKQEIQKQAEKDEKSASTMNKIVSEIEKNQIKMNSFDELIDIF